MSSSEFQSLHALVVGVVPAGLRAVVVGVVLVLARPWSRCRPAVQRFVPLCAMRRCALLEF